MTSEDKADVEAYGWDQATQHGPYGVLQPRGEPGFAPLEHVYVHHQCGVEDAKQQHAWILTIVSKQYVQYCACPNVHVLLMMAFVCCFILVIINRWYRPSIDVVGLVAGHTGEGIKTILPAKAIAKLSSRIVPNMDPAAALRALRAHLQQHAPPTANLSFVEVDFSAAAYDCPRDSLGNRVAARVLQRIMGLPARYERSGGTIPALALFKQHLGIDTTVFGFGLPDDSIHAPDERYSLEFFKTGRDAVVEFLFELGGAQREPGPGDDESRDEL